MFLVNSHEDVKKTLHQLWFYEPLLAFLKLRKFPSTSLNLIFVSVTYYHLSNLVKVEQILMVKIMVTIFPSKERHKWLSKRSHKKQTEQTFPFGSLNFFFPNSVSNVCVFCFAILSWNLPGRFMDLLRRFMHLLAFIISKTSSVYRYAAFPVQCYIIFHCQFGWMDSSFHTENL